MPIEVETDRPPNFDFVDRGAPQIQRETSAGIAAEIEAAAVAQQQAGFVDLVTDLHGPNLAIPAPSRHCEARIDGARGAQCCSAATT